MNRTGFTLGISLLVVPLILAFIYVVDVFNKVAEFSQGMPSADPDDVLGKLIMACVVFGVGSLLGCLIVGYNFDSLSGRPRWLFYLMLAVGVL